MAVEKTPRKPTALRIVEDESDTLFFSFEIIEPEFDDDEQVTIPSLCLVSDVGGQGEEDDMAYLYEVGLDDEDLRKLISWAEKALKYTKYAATRGPVIKLELSDDNAD